LVNAKEPSHISHIDFEIIKILYNIKNNKEVDLTHYIGAKLKFATDLINNSKLMKQIKESDSFIGKDLYDDSNVNNTYSYGDSPEYFYKLKELAENTENIVVFDPEQIHILGSKQDIEGFKKFVDTSIQAPVSTVKLGVEESFEYNPELANAVYKAALV